MSKKVRRLTVSEFIRESKTDWEHVRTIEKRTSTQPYSGPLIARVDSSVSTGDQVDAQMRQILGEEEPDTFWGEEIIAVDDREEEEPVSGLPTGD
jgi:hypothetical protein